MMTYSHNGNSGIAFKASNKFEARKFARSEGCKIIAREGKAYVAELMAKKQLVGG